MILTLPSGCLAGLTQPYLRPSRIDPCNRPEEHASQDLEIRLYGLCASSGGISEPRDDIAFFQAVRVWMAKFDVEDRCTRSLPIPADVALYLRQLTAGVIEAQGVTDIYAAAGIERPDLSHLDEAYLETRR